jgi:hypothetical protein
MVHGFVHRVACFGDGGNHQLGAGTPLTCRDVAKSLPIPWVVSYLACFVQQSWNFPFDRRKLLT